MSSNAKQVLSNLYGLMMEINYHHSEEDLKSELREKQDPQIEKHLVKIMQMSAKLKARQNTFKFQTALEQIRIIKEKGVEELKKLVRPQKQEQLVPLFRKFEELTIDDQESILEDQELLLLIESLNKKINDNPE